MTDGKWSWRIERWILPIGYDVEIFLPDGRQFGPFFGPVGPMAYMSIGPKWMAIRKAKRIVKRRKSKEANTFKGLIND